MSVVFGRKYSLFINDGLGAYLTEIGLAKSFHVYSEWIEVIERNSNKT